MEPLAAGRLDEAGEAKRLQPVAHLPRRLDHRLEAEAFGRVEIEDDPVGAVGRAPP